MTRKLLLLGTVVGTLGFLTPGYAEVWNFDSPTGDLLSTTHNYTGTGGITITATGFSGGNLFGKNDGGDENGVGFANTEDNEIVPGTFIQLDLSHISFSSTTNTINMSFQGLSNDQWR